jgi:hypothetical protein
MSIFTKKNALVGFITLKALERRRQRRRRHARKLLGFVVLGIVSAGILAALAAVVVRRQRETVPEPGADAAGDWGSSELDAEFHEPSFTA